MTPGCDIGSSELIVAAHATYDSVKLGALVALRPAALVFALSRAKLAKVLGGSRNGVFEEFESDSAERLPCMLMVRLDQIISDQSRQLASARRKASNQTNKTQRQACQQEIRCGIYVSRVLVSRFVR